MCSLAHQLNVVPSIMSQVSLGAILLEVIDMVHSPQKVVPF